jgi:hypothetical protein
VLVDGQRLGDQDVLLVLHRLDQTVEGCRFAAADEPNEGQELATMDGDFDVVEHLAQLLGLEVAGSRQVAGQAVVLHHVAAHVILRAGVSG